MFKMIIYFIVFTFYLSFFGNISKAQKPYEYHTGDIIQMLRKLNVLGSVLYVAAHPDDENTRLIAYMANGAMLNTAYLSATRGDGGQNLIGPEIREQLGIIRTQELLAARRVDGGSQFFSRANDFGYSKTPDETFNIWDKEKVLADFVWAIRNFRPDIIITRFNLEPGYTHGHHTASAILAKEAFELAGDPSYRPNQLKHVEPWNPKKIFWNTSHWFYRRRDIEFDTTGLNRLNVGSFNHYLGKSYTEIAAESRSMHKSQGFGATGSRGDEVEYFVQWEGKDTRDVIGGIDFTWGRIDGGDKVGFHIDNAIMNFDPDRPYVIVADLIKARKELLKLKDQYWKDIKLSEINKLIAAVTGLYLEVKSDDYTYTAGDSLKISIEAINRSPIDIGLETFTVDQLYEREELNQSLENNTAFNSDKAYVLPGDIDISQPYWLNEQATLGMYYVDDLLQIGKPENAPPLSVTFTISVDGELIDYTKPIIFKRNDPVKGEVYRPLAITPPVMVDIMEDVVVFDGKSEKTINVRVVAGKDNVNGSVFLELPGGWQSEPASFDYSIDSKGAEQRFKFDLIAPKSQQVGEIKAKIRFQGNANDQGLVNIEYDHIQDQALFPEAIAKVVKIDLEKRGEHIGYIMGAGDKIPESLRQIGYEVDLLTEVSINGKALNNYDAIILGIRALNTEGWLEFKKEQLMDYVEQGGNLIVQYSTSYRLKVENFSPYEFKISRDRVTVEEAEVRFLAPDHHVLNTPNKITDKDFEGWVQERGLYFSDEWSEAFKPVLSSNDPGEDPKNGGLLVAKHGAGYFIYTGYSWFRQLPAGVPGAYRIFTNLISVGMDEETTSKSQ